MAETAAQLAPARERPVLFRPEMVRAILAGKKTMTRRPVKGMQPKAATEVLDWGEETVVGVSCARPGWFTGRLYGSSYSWAIRCPYGAAGDRLWVRETFAEVHPIAVPEGRFSMEGRAGIPGPPPVTYRVIYRADGDPLPYWHCQGYPYRALSPADDELGEIERKHHPHGVEAPGWTPGIHMPRWACRLVLEVTAVRVERVQAITEEDARAEGFQPSRDETWTAYDPQCDGYPTFFAPPPSPPYENVRHHVREEPARRFFETAWRHMYLDTPFAWDENPWVWVVEFRRVEAARSAA